MEAEIIKKDSKSITIQVTIPLSEDMLTTEESIQQGVNQAGMIATQYALSQHDTNGEPIKVGEKKYTSKGKLSKTYQCPFGEFDCVVMCIRVMKVVVPIVRWTTMLVSLYFPRPNFPRW